MSNIWITDNTYDLSFTIQLANIESTLSTYYSGKNGINKEATKLKIVYAINTILKGVSTQINLYLTFLEFKDAKNFLKIIHNSPEQIMINIERNYNEDYEDKMKKNLQIISNKNKGKILEILNYSIEQEQKKEKL